jgi:hypothetical protein
MSIARRTRGGSRSEVQTGEGLRSSPLRSPPSRYVLLGDSAITVPIYTHTARDRLRVVGWCYCGDRHRGCAANSHLAGYALPVEPTASAAAINDSRRNMQSSRRRPQHRGGWLAGIHLPMGFPGLISGKIYKAVVARNALFYWRLWPRPERVPGSVNDCPCSRRR